VSAWEIFGLVVAGLLVLALIAPSIARRAIRRRRWRRAARGGDAELAHAAWRELQDDLVDYQAGYSPSESPRAVGTRLAARVGKLADTPAGARSVAASRDSWSMTDAPLDVVTIGAPVDQLTVGEEPRQSQDGVAAVKRIAMAEERARYAPHPVPGRDLRRDSVAVRRALSATAPRSTRWLARVLPSSVMTPTARGVSQMADVFGRVSPGWFTRGGMGRRLGRRRTSPVP